MSLEAVGNAFKFKSASDDDVFIGEPADAVFHPLAKLNRWGDECFLKFVFDDSEVDTKNVRVNDEKVEWDTPTFTFRYYPTADGLEFEVVLKVKPLKNSFSFSIDSQNLKFFYQRPLTEEFNPDDCVELSEIYARLKNGGEFWRPERVVGSYAVCHDSKRDNQYQTGKAFHIYRPQVIDASGAKAWATLNIDEQLGMMIVTLPEDFLDHATYPVVVDPTFGYTSIGASSAPASANTKTACRFQLTENGILSKITCYNSAVSGSGNVKGVIYNDSSGAPNAKQGSDSAAVSISTTPAWRDWIVTPTLTAGYYWLAQIIEAAVNFSYDSGAANQTAQNADTYSDGFSDPFGTPTYYPLILSMYATYTIIKTVTESLSLSDAVLRNKTFAVADSIGVADAVRGNKSPLIVADAVSLSELINIITGAIIKIVADAIGISDMALLNKTAIIADAVNLADVARALKTLNVSDTLSLVDSASTPSRVIRALESIILADNAYVNKILQITEAVSLAEIVEVGAGSAKKTKLFLILGDLAVQLTGD